MKKVEVVAAIIKFGEEILCVQKPKHKFDYISYKYEFPGGKIEEGESHEQAVLREIIEELNLKVTIRSFFTTIIYSYPDFELTMHSYLCDVDTKELTLNEHINYQWLYAEHLAPLNWAAADLPIVKKLMATQ